MYVYKIKSQSPFRMKFNVTTERIIDELSDHYPVIGTVIFDEETSFVSIQIEAPPCAKNNFHSLNDIYTSYNCCSFNFFLRPDNE